MSTKNFKTGTRRTLKDVAELDVDANQTLVGQNTNRHMKPDVMRKTLERKNAPTEVMQIVGDNALPSTKIKDAAQQMFDLLNVIVVEAECVCNHAGSCYWCHAKALVKRLRS